MCTCSVYLQCVHVCLYWLDEEHSRTVSEHAAIQCNGSIEDTTIRVLIVPLPTAINCYFETVPVLCFVSFPVGCCCFLSIVFI